MRSAFEQYLAAAKSYWDNNRSCDDGDAGVILVDLSHDAFDYLLTSLHTAKAVQSKWGGRLVGIGMETSLVHRACAAYDPEKCRQLGSAFGIDDFVSASRSDYEEAFAGSLHGCLREIVTASTDDGTITRDALSHRAGAANTLLCGYESALRSNLVPGYRTVELPLLRSLSESTYSLKRITELFELYDVRAVVSGHLDYNPWRILCEMASMKGAQIFNFETGKRIAVWSIPPGERVSLNRLKARGSKIAFEKAVQASNPGSAARPSPSIQDGGRLLKRGSFEILTALSSAPARQAVREDVLRMVGWDATVDVVVVYAHTFSDIPLSDDQEYSDLEDWLESTIAIAESDASKNWIFKAHPLDSLYDVTSLFEKLARQHANAKHIRFMRNELSPAELLCCASSTVTVRGTIGIESIAAGVPCLLAGRSPYSEIGFSEYYTDKDAYAAALRSPPKPVTPQLRDLARCYMAFDSIVADVRCAAIPNFSWYEVDSQTYFLEALRRMRVFVEQIDPFRIAVRELVNDRCGRAVTPLWVSRQVQIGDRSSVRTSQNDFDLQFGRCSADSDLLIGGFHPSETSLTWSNRTRALIAVPLRKDHVGKLRLALTAHVLSPRQRVRVILQSGASFAVELSTSVGDAEFELGHDDIDEGDLTVLRFEVSELCSPQSIGLNDDTRDLGIAVLALRTV